MVFRRAPEDLVGAVQVVQVGAREVPAGVAAAGLVQRARVGAVARVLDLHVAEAREEPAVARVAGRHDAVEHVDAGGDRVDEVLRRAHAHQVARPVRGQPRRRVGDDARHVLLGLAHRDAADGVAVEADGLQRLARFVAQVLVHAALHDAEERVGVALVGLPRALRPAQRQPHRLAPPRRAWPGRPCTRRRSSRCRNRARAGCASTPPGVRKSLSPLMGDWKATPSSLTLRSGPRL